MSFLGLIIYIYSQYYGFGVDQGQASTDHFDPMAEVPVSIRSNQDRNRVRSPRICNKKGGSIALFALEIEITV